MLHAKASFRLFSVSGEAGTSIVDICQKKIQDALQADSVKVTGQCSVRFVRSPCREVYTYIQLTLLFIRRLR
jgi:hypothetical protein